MGISEVPTFWGEELAGVKLDALAFLDPIPNDLESAISQAIQAEMNAMASEGHRALSEYKDAIEKKLKGIKGYDDAMANIPKHKPHTEDPSHVSFSSSEADYSIIMSGVDLDEDLKSALTRQAKLKHDIDMMKVLVGEGKDVELKETFQAYIIEQRAMNDKLESHKRSLDHEMDEVSKKRKLVQLKNVGDLKSNQETLYRLQKKTMDLQMMLAQTN
eukprot:GHVH01010555.1.p1 GENE.GHVH01010555.1~~GHVH01010555.1.p1  ORF type:complete len:228 (+),score=50.44 GHVH01010555.1:37-684(+)